MPAPAAAKPPPPLSDAAPSSLRRSCRGLLQDFLDALPHPLEALLRGGLRKSGPCDQHIVLALLHLRQKRAPRLTELALDPVTDNRGAVRLRHREPEPRLFAAVVPRKPVENEEAGRHRTALPVDRIEVARTTEPVPAVDHVLTP